MCVVLQTVYFPGKYNHEGVAMTQVNVIYEVYHKQKR